VCRADRESPFEETFRQDMLGQSFNIDAFKMFGRIVHKPELIVPHISIPHIGFINWPALADAGIKGVVFDKDNTLTAPYIDAFDERVLSSVEQCRKIFGNQLVIISNSAGGPDDEGYAAAKSVEAALRVHVLRRRSKKPSGFNELLTWFNSADNVNNGLAQIQPSELCMVGDRALTDVVFGNHHGMMTIHVQPLTSNGDNKVS
jgi:phosphatidylglycerophosphatase GEP4